MTTDTNFFNDKKNMINLCIHNFIPKTNDHVYLYRKYNLMMHLGDMSVEEIKDFYWCMLNYNRYWKG